MSYFNHAYKKTMLAGSLVTSGTDTSVLGAGAVGIADASTYGIVNVTSAATVPSEFIIAQGNYNTVDTIGGNALHGGYSESIKSKVIKPHFVTKVWKGGCTDLACQTSTIYVKDNCFSCTDHAQLRIDVKGDPILRALNHNLYKILDAKECCTATGDPAVYSYTANDVVTAWAAKITEDETLNPWLTATATAGACSAGGHATQALCEAASETWTAASLAIQLCNAETTFDDCSFDTRDHYNTQPLQLTLTEIDDEGDACSTGCIETTTGTNMPSEGVTIYSLENRTLGETILRDLILDGRYRQDGGHNQGNRDSARRRDIEGGDALIAAVNRAATYSVYYIQHSVPRYNNPTGVFDNDQYLVQVAVKCTDTSLISSMDTLFGLISEASGLTTGGALDNLDS